MYKSSVSLSRLTCLSLLIVALCCLSPLRSQAITSDLPPEFLAGFAFFKYAKVEPDFQDWVYRSVAYQKASPRERTVMLRTMTQDLQTRFAIYDVKEAPLELKARLTFGIPTQSMANRMIKEDGLVTIKMTLMDHKENYFPLQVAGMWIAVIPEDIDKLLTLRIHPDEFASFKRRLGEQGLTGRVETVLNLTMLPTGADTKMPLQMDGFDLWMLMTEVLKLEILSADGKKNAWYIDIPGQERRMADPAINNLYHD